ncbi:MAG: class I SAM-dependent methyltransferase [Phycisphaerales bacterium]|nr:MAG: class I SAM-dependent methyltransferase [Phycisphaerales bacterium]
MAEAHQNAQDFRRVAAAYDLLIDEERRWARERPALERWLSAAGEGRKRVIDLGCGTGFHARHLAGMLDADAVAADPAPHMLEVGRAKPHGDRIQWICTPAEQPPPGPFDLALLLGNTLSLITDPVEVFRAVRRIVVTDGLFVMQTLDYDKLRQMGGEHRTASGGGMSIEKRLTPHDAGSGVGAVLQITIRDDAGEVLAHQENSLLDHDPDALISAAAENGWRVTERRASYEDGSDGNDRILVFAREISR